MLSQDIQVSSGIISFNMYSILFKGLGTSQIKPKQNQNTLIITRGSKT